MNTSANPAITHVLTVTDGDSGEVLDFIEIPNFNILAFAQQFAVPLESDPEMLDRYAVGPDDVAFLEGEIGRSLSFDFGGYGYFIEAVTRE